MRCTGMTAQWCPNHGDCTCPDIEEAMDSPNCPLHSRESNHPFPSEGKVVAVRPDADTETASALGFPIIRSEAVPKGMMFVIDLDKLGELPTITGIGAKPPDPDPRLIVERPADEL